MIVNRQAGIIQRKASQNFSEQQISQPTRNSIEWKNKKQAFNNSAQQILSRGSMNDKIYQLEDFNDIENTNNINVIQNQNIFFENNLNENGITLDGSSKLFIQKNIQTSITQDGRDREISFSKNEELSDQPSMSKDGDHNILLNTQNGFARISQKKSFIGDDQKIDLYSNVQNNMQQQQQTSRRENMNFQKNCASQQYEQVLTDLGTDEDIEISNNTSALILNNISVSNQNAQTDVLSQQRKSQQNISENINQMNHNFQLPSRRSTSSLHSNNSQNMVSVPQQNFQQQLTFQKNVFRKLEDQIDSDDKQSQNEEYFKKRPPSAQGFKHQVAAFNIPKSISNNQIQQKEQVQQQTYTTYQDNNAKSQQQNHEIMQLNQNQAPQVQQQNTYATSIVNYCNQTSTEDQFEYNDDETAPLPSTFRRILNENGLKYNVQEYDRLVKMIPNESEMNRFKYYFLPLKIQEQEKIIDQSNQNILQLQESIQILLKRESQIRQEYSEYQSQVQRDISQLQDRQKQLSKDLMDKENMIQSVQIQVESKNNEIQSLQLKLQKQRLDFSNYEQTKAEIEFSMKEKDMKIELIMKENQEIKIENKQLREEKLQLVEQITELERNIQIKDSKAAKLIIDRKNQNDDYSIRQNALLQENQQLREEMNLLTGQNRKLMKNLQDYKSELESLKQTVFDLASSIPSFKSIQIEQYHNNNNSAQDQIPSTLVNQYIELLKQQLQHLKSVEEYQSKKGVSQKADGFPKKDQNKFEGNVSTFRRQELD
ncbi:hypothetical protein TTHERM_00865390 (macronuclear) [Tetrahymena thermophila SB210]|uniref:Uncharacterized protein n=1 Tax=Tetrahymena thermophila (strain SB210) TaxID=312017 RepID=Q24FC4_TETTS|nr:hypothetical protein TTHERM_00865390 [Tetrahymena thermophila SB210]EAS06534.2 hypothetical protein TTHERM_00865390 [Tetrahymena thermophila SB210]|eukprot:XP_001026779.2 hypothetical protein TTHERM_00865390 [Tetrahymena thermophila SB210]